MELATRLDSVFTHQPVILEWVADMIKELPNLYGKKLVAKGDELVPKVGKQDGVDNNKVITTFVNALSKGAQGDIEEYFKKQLTPANLERGNPLKPFAKVIAKKYGGNWEQILEKLRNLVFNQAKADDLIAEFGIPQDKPPQVAPEAPPAAPVAAPAPPAPPVPAPEPSKGVKPIEPQKELASKFDSALGIEPEPELEVPPEEPEPAALLTQRNIETLRRAGFTDEVINQMNPAQAQQTVDALQRATPQKAPATPQELPQEADPVAPEPEPVAPPKIKATPRPGRASMQSPAQLTQKAANIVMQALNQATYPGADLKSRIIGYFSKGTPKMVAYAKLLSRIPPAQVNSLRVKWRDEIVQSNPNRWGLSIIKMLEGQPQALHAIMAVGQALGRPDSGAMTEGFLETMAGGLGGLARGVANKVQSVKTAYNQGRAGQPQAKAQVGANEWAQAAEAFKARPDDPKIQNSYILNFVLSMPQQTKDAMFQPITDYVITNFLRAKVEDPKFCKVACQDIGADPTTVCNAAPAPAPQAAPKAPEKAPVAAAPDELDNLDFTPGKAPEQMGESKDKTKKFMTIESAASYDRGLKPLDPAKMQVPGYNNIDKQLFVAKYVHLKEMLERARNGLVTADELQDVNELKKIRFYKGDAGVVEYIASHAGDQNNDLDPDLGGPDGYIYEGKFIRPNRKPILEFKGANQKFTKTLDKVLNEDWKVAQNSELSEEVALDVLLILKKELRKVECILMSVPTFRFNLNGFDITNIEIKCTDPRKIIERLQNELPEVRYDFPNSPSVYAYLAVNKAVGQRVRDELGLDIMHYDLQGDNKSEPGIAVRKPQIEKPVPETPLPGGPDLTGGPGLPPTPSSPEAGMPGTVPGGAPLGAPPAPGGEMPPPDMGAMPPAPGAPSPMPGMPPEPTQPELPPL